MNDTLKIAVKEDARARTLCTAEQYEVMYAASIADPDAFWAEHGQRISWMKPFTKVKNTSYEGDISIKWFEDGTLNASVNCIDRHLAEKANDSALIWEGDNPNDSRNITYQELHDEVCRFAGVLKGRNVKKGDRVTLYMPMIPEAVYAMLACARIGAVHSVIFGGFSPEAIAGRIHDCKSTCVITADEGVRGAKPIPLKANVDTAIEICEEKYKSPVETVIVVKHTEGNINWVSNRDVWYRDLADTMPTTFEPEEMSAEDPLFILYTSGSTGAPKGVLHTTGGYMVWASMTHEYVFDYKQGETYWCTADVGWITGHSYIVYGPLSNGATSLVFEGIPTYPDVGRVWQVIEKHKVNIFYTAPTAIRALMIEGDAPVKAHDRSSLRLLGSVGEPINPEAWHWYYETVGDKRCPILDTWWQTETGGIMISPLPGATDLKAGSATKPFFGIQPALVDGDGKELTGAVSGNLIMKDSWPGQMRTLYGDHERFKQTYFTTYEGTYFTGDGCKRDEDGYYWITGRVDDVLNVSGHRMGTAEVESALAAHALVGEAAVVGYPHDIKGQGIYAYVTCNAGTETDDTLRHELIQWVRKEIGVIATIDKLQFTPSLPKTRSGKIMRRILRKVAEGDFRNLGDTSTLAEPSVVDSLIENRLS